MERYLRFGPTGIFRTTSRNFPFCSVGPKFAVTFWQTGSMPWVLLHRFWVSREKERFDWKMSFHFSLVTTTGLWSILLAQWRAPTESNPDLVLRHATLTHREHCVTTRGQWFDQWRNSPHQGYKRRIRTKKENFMLNQRMMIKRAWRTLLKMFFSKRKPMQSFFPFSESEVRRKVSKEL